MPRTSGRKAKITIDDAGTNPPTLVFAEMSNWSYSEQEEESSYRTINSDALKYDEGVLTYTGGMRVWLDPADVAQAKLTVGADRSILAHPVGDASGNPTLQGDIHILSVAHSIEAEDYVALDVTYRADAPLTPGTVGP